ncbi:reverse transcriptase family protein [Mycobacterium avium MAV_120809_2495]|nr:reverse transcriptase family protein [Mycobacterium avium MAV_120809_2495]
MAKGPSGIDAANTTRTEALVNTGELSWPDPDQAAWQVRQMQRKLHHWAVEDSDRRFDDVFNLVHHPDFLTVAWERVRGNKGARSAGVDRLTPASITGDAETVAFLSHVRTELKARTFAPLPVREILIPKPGSSKLRRLGIPTAMDRTVQASLLLVLEPIFEADFEPVSYGFRPRRRAQDAIAEIHALGTRNYHWVFEADIAACFDELAHSAIMERVRTRIVDKRVLALIKAFLKAGIMSGDGTVRESDTGTPQGGILSPLLANIALTVLDAHFRVKWDAHRTSQRRDAHRKRGGALSDRPLCRRFRDHGGRNQSARGRIMGRSRGCHCPTGATAIRGEDPGMPPRRGVRLSRIPHPAAPQEGHEQGSCLHLPVEEGAAFDHDEGAGADQEGTSSWPC